MLDQHAAEGIADPMDQDRREEFASLVARAILLRSGTSQDPATLERLTRILDTKDLDGIAAYLADELEADESQDAELQDPEPQNAA
jgi:predicted Ser/Thr protein kinase